MHFRYRLQGDDIEHLVDDEESLSWTTEIPISKFYAALELGESLTAMYMRINDAVFDADTDQGSQYASARHRAALENDGLIGSMSSVGNPYDNAQAESFMKILKTEEVSISGCETFADVAARLPRFIEHVYNAKRVHSALDYVSPDHFEAQLAQQAA